MKAVVLKLSVLIVLNIAVAAAKCQTIEGIQGAAVNNNTGSSSRGEVITKKDDEKIKRSALYTVKEFENDLNVLSKAPGMDSSEVNEIIRNRYADEKRKIFYDSTAVIEDDIWNTTANTAEKVQEKQVARYLSDFDIYYKKNNTASIAFNNLKASNIKKGGYLYIKVFYDCQFNGKSRSTDSPYVRSKRVAELKVEKVDNKWRTWIINVHFFNSADSANKTKNDVAIVEVPEQNAATTDTVVVEPLAVKIDSTKVLDVAERERLEKENEKRRNEMAYRALIAEGDDAYHKKDYPTAYQKYQYASKIKPDEDYPKTMSDFAKKEFEQNNVTPEQQYNQLIQKAKVAEHRRKYEEARDYYNKALNIKPEEEPKQKVRALTDIIKVIVQGDEKFNAGNYKEAIKIYEKKNEEHNPDYILKKGECYEKLGDLKQALKDYTTAISLDPTYVEAYQQRANLYEQNKNYADALVDYKMCLSINKEDVTVLVKIADLHRAVNNLKEAKEALDKAIQIDPAKAVFYYKKGELLYEEKNLAEAIDNFSTAIKKDADYAAAYYYKGLCEVDLKKVEEAAADFVKARKLGIDNTCQNRIASIAADFYKEGLARFNSNKMDTAITWFNYAILTDAGKDEYHFKRGECFFNLKEYDKAILNYTKAVEINPKYYDAYKQRGVSKYYLSRFKEGISDFETASKIETKIPQTYKLIGDGYFMLKDYSTAIHKYDTTLLVSKASKTALEESVLADLYNNRGEAYFRMNDYVNALADFKNAVRIVANDGRLYFNRGKTFFKLSKLDEAEADLTKALSQYPQNAVWNYTLGQVYQQKGQYEKAINFYSTSISIDTALSIGIQPIYNRAKCYVNKELFADALKDYLFIKENYATTIDKDIENETGNVYLELNRPDKAIECFNEALAMDAADVEAIYNTGVAYVQKKEPENALPFFEKAFASGKFKKDRVKDDRRIEEIRSYKPFKSLMKKYF